MRLANFRFNVDVRTAVLAGMILAACGCQTAHKPVALLPPGSAPALQPTPAPAPVSAQASQPAPQGQKKDAQSKGAPAKDTSSAETSSSPSAASDPVADLIARAEAEYQAGLASYHAGRQDDAKQNFDSAL